MFGIKTILFEKFVKGRNIAIFPWSLSIVDCHFIFSAFQRQSQQQEVRLLRLSDEGRAAERVSISSAYDLYDIDSDADGFEIVLTDEVLRSTCYWDIHERFVIVSGSSAFLELARPFPEDIERHRFIETMGHLDERQEGAEYIYDQLRNR